MADGIVDETKTFVEAHPYASGGIALGVLLLLVLILGGHKTAAPTTVVQAPDTSGTAAAAQLGAAQIAANASNVQAQIAAGVANTNTAAQLQATVTASNNATQLATTQANDATTIAQAQAGAATAQSGNLTLSNEFSSLAQALTAFATQQNSVTTQSSGTQGAQIASVLNTADSNAAGVQNTFTNDYYGAFNNIVSTNGGFAGIEPIASGTAQSAYGSGATQSGGGYSAADLATIFAGASTTTSNTTALNGEQFLEGLNGLTAKVGDGVAFHAQ